MTLRVLKMRILLFFKNLPVAIIYFILFFCKSRIVMHWIFRFVVCNNLVCMHFLVLIC